MASMVKDITKDFVKKHDYSGVLKVDGGTLGSFGGKVLVCNSDCVQMEPNGPVGP